MSAPARDLRNVVGQYRRSGIHTLRLRPLEKRPIGKWKDSESAEPSHFKESDNVGVVLGDKSCGLVDIDLDQPEAALIADHLFAELPAFGRQSAPRSHRIATCPDGARRKELFSLQNGDAHLLGLDSDDDKSVVVELRGNGHYTMFPPSLHPSGELVEWQFNAEPPDKTWDELKRRCGLCAFLAVVLRTYPRVSGNRDDICLALAGALLSAGIGEAETDQLVQLVATLASDEEASHRGNKAKGTRAKMRAGGPWWGLPKLCELLGIAPLEERLRSWITDGTAPGETIVVAEGRLVQIVDAAEQKLIENGVPLYQRGQALVRTALLDASTDEAGVHRARGSLILMEATRHWLTEQFARSAKWVKPKGDEGKFVLLDPPLKYASHYLARAGNWNVPPLLGVVHTPTLRPDGTLLQQPGYDASSALLYDPAGVEFPPVPEAPTREQAEDALCAIEELFSGFPFVDDAARSVVTSAVLTALVRRSLRTAPLFAIDAPTAGTGKSLIAETIGVLATGHVPSMMSQGKSAEEDEKRLSTLLMAGDPVIVVDNCDLPLEGDFLCSMLTQQMVQARILGRSERVQLPSNAMVLATGNNLTLAGDVTRRAVLCRMDAGVERPDVRQFDCDPREVAASRRAELVVAGLTVLRSYLAAGRPHPLPKIGSFEDWNLIREPLVWLGRTDPGETRQHVLANDPRKGELVEILTAWRHCFLGNEMTLSNVRAYCLEDLSDPGRETLYQLLVDQTGKREFSARSIGRHLKRHVDKVVGGMVLRRRDGKWGIAWRVAASGDQHEFDYSGWPVGLEGLEGLPATQGI